MKNLNLIIWLTQLGYSVAFPLAGFTLAAVWLRQKFNLGSWVLLTGIVIGIICAIDGFRTSLKAMERMANDRPSNSDPPPVAFNDHQ